MAGVYPLPCLVLLLPPLVHNNEHQDAIAAMEDVEVYRGDNIMITPGSLHEEGESEFHIDQYQVSM